MNLPLPSPLTWSTYNLAPTATEFVVSVKVRCQIYFLVYQCNKVVLELKDGCSDLLLSEGQSSAVVHSVVQSMKQILEL